MKSRKGDKLPAIPQLSQIRDELLDLRVRKSRSLPVKRRTQIVRKHQIGVFCKDSLRKFPGNVEVRSGGLHPEHVCKLSKLEASLDTVLHVTFDPVETFFRSAGFPVKFQLKSELSGKNSGLTKGKICAVLAPCVNELLLLLWLGEDIHDFSDSCLREGQEQVGVGRVNLAENVRVVKGVDISINEGC